MRMRVWTVHRLCGTKDRKRPVDPSMERGRKAIILIERFTWEWSAAFAPGIIAARFALPMRSLQPWIGPGRPCNGREKEEWLCGNIQGEWRWDF